MGMEIAEKKNKEATIEQTNMLSMQRSFFGFNCLNGIE